MKYELPYLELCWVGDDLRVTLFYKIRFSGHYYLCSLSPISENQCIKAKMSALLAVGGAGSSKSYPQKILKFCLVGNKTDLNKQSHGGHRPPNHELVPL